MRCFFLRSLLMVLIAAPIAASGQVTDPENEQPLGTPAELLSFEMDFDAEVGLIRFKEFEGDTDRYFSTVFLPSFRYGKWGGGLRLKLRFNKGGFREADYDSFGDALSILRFVSYAEKNASGWYVRAGELEEVTLGYGHFVREYRNTVSLDEPKTGTVVDFERGDFLIETMFSDVVGAEIFAARGAYRPFLDDPLSKLRNMDFGVTFAGDLSDDGRLINSDDAGAAFLPDAPSLAERLAGIEEGSDDGALTMMAIDAGMPIRTRQTDELLAYGELGTIFGYGSGLSLGLQGLKRFEGGQVEAWVEQRFMGAKYLPNYFNSLYEVERIRETDITTEGLDTVSGMQTKRNRLLGRDSFEMGSFFKMEARLSRTYRVQWSYEHAWNRSASGWFHLDVRVRNDELPYQMRLMYDRISVDELEDIWSGNGADAIVRLDIAYQFWKHILLGFRFRQSFEPVERDGRVVGQDKRTRIEPNFVIRL